MASGLIDMKSLIEQLRRYNIPNAEGLATLAAISWRIFATRTLLGNLALGASRFGGSPDVPEVFLWPTRDGEPLTFLAQLDLTEVQAPDLPATGWLLFFYDVARSPWGFDPRDAGGSRVVFMDASREALVRREHPLTDEGGPFRPCSLIWSQTFEMPHEWDRIIADTGIPIPKELWGAYASIGSSVSGVVSDEKLVGFHINQHNSVVPHSAFH
jgi:hypothetical protein